MSTKKERIRLLNKVAKLTGRHSVSGELRIPREVAELDVDAFYRAIDSALTSGHKHQSLIFEEKWNGEIAKSTEYELRKPPKFRWHAAERVGVVKFHTYVFSEGVDTSVDRPWDPRPESTVTVCRWQIDEWIRKGIRGIVIDLSDHRGGSYRPAMHALGEHLLKDQTLFELVDRDGKHTPVLYSNDREADGERKGCGIGRLSKIRVAIVVSSHTASSGEIVAAMLAGREGVRTFGKSTTAGALSINEGYDLVAGYRMMLTVRKYASCSGVIYEDETIHPDAITSQPMRDAVRWASLGAEEEPRISAGSPSRSVSHSLSQRHIRSTFERLGFRQQVLDRAFPMSEREARRHTSSQLKNSIPRLWREWRQARRTSRLNASSSIEDVLFDAGFDSRVAKRLAAVVGPLESSAICPYTRDQIVDIAISYSLGWDHRPIRKRVPFPKNVDNRDRWFQLQGEDEELGHGDLWHANVDSESAMDVIKSMPGSSNAEGGVGSLYFHATSWRSACNIARTGRPSNKSGRDCLDFGILPSFYTTPSLDTAIGRIEAHWDSWRGESAILVFSLPKALTDSLDDVGLSVCVFESADDAWKRLTKQSHMCQEETNELDMVDLVYGPMVSNPSAVEERNAQPRAHNPPKYQLASKSDAGDKFMGANMRAVMWVNKLQ